MSGVTAEAGRPYSNGILRRFATAQAPGGGPVQWGGPVELADQVLQLELDANGNFFTTVGRPLPRPRRVGSARTWGVSRSSRRRKTTS